MNRSKAIVVTVIAAVTALLSTIGCSRDVAGATTETTNGIAGSVRTVDDQPAANAVVKLFPAGYDPVAGSSLDGGFIDTTDEKGRYRFSRIEPGRYTVLARNGEAATSFLVKDIAVDGDSVTPVPEGTLKRPGSIAADFSRSVTVESEYESEYMYIPGTDIYSHIGTDGSAVLAGVPTGTVDEIMFASDNSEPRNMLRSGITVTSDDTTTVELPLWKYGCRLVLNTTPAGADVATDVYRFPVLVRLYSGNFDFSQAGADGKDLIFTGKGNTVLPHEIERWNPVAKLAEVWVRVDTIRGNDSTQSIAMYWGNADVAGVSADTAVFDTASGFQGVWHLGDGAGDSAYDATVNRYHGVSSETARPSVDEGVIGKCRVFDGVADFISMPNTAEGNLNFPQSGNYTVCAWVYADTIDGASHCIVSKGYEQYYLRLKYSSIKFTLPETPSWEFVEFGEIESEGTWQTLTTPAAQRQWSLLIGVRNGNEQSLYCNGVLVNNSIVTFKNSVARNTANELFFGRFKNQISVPISEGYCYFKGGIDEVRILNVAQESDWVRLCYMNQRPDDRLVVFKDETGGGITAQ
jgi:hypothetical protein